ncbi:MAG: hypothetical protein AB7T22_11625 [Calditrichaceae bacterium]
MIRYKILVMVSSIILYTAVFAQDQDFVSSKIDMLQQDLELTEAQKTQVQEIYEYSIRESENLKTINRGDPGAIRAAMNDLQSLTARQIYNILTPEQQKKFPEIQSKITIPRETNNRELQNLKEKLKLTDDQVIQIEPIIEAQQAEMEKMREENSGDRREMMMKMQTIMKVYENKIKEVLSDEQKELYDKYLEEKRSSMQQGGGSGRGGKGKRRF